MTEKRFFILTDDEYDDIRPCIRDRTFKMNDIYGDYKYDDLNEICNEFNRLNDENEQLKSICQDHRDHAIDFKADCVRLEKENEQLKQQFNSVYEIVKEYVMSHHCMSTMRMLKKIGKGDVE